MLPKLRRVSVIIKVITLLIIVGLVGFFLIIPTIRAFASLHPRQVFVSESLIQDLGLKYENVTFKASDGVNLEGWYLPSKNKSAIILTHGFSDSRLNLLEIAQFLNTEGFGVLLYDTRGHGNSEKVKYTRGWVEINDVLGGVDYLVSRNDIDTDKIGAFGFSIGGQTTLRAAAKTNKIKALVVDGIATLDVYDETTPDNFNEWINYPTKFIYYGIIKLNSKIEESNNVLTAVRKISSPIMFISAGEGQEQRQIKRFYSLANQPKQLWEITDAKHIQGILIHPEEYKERLTTFFTEFLLNK